MPNITRSDSLGQKDSELKEIILLLSAYEEALTEEAVPKLAQAFNQIYDEDYRHWYSLCFEWVMEIQEDARYRSERLNQHLVRIQNYIDHNSEAYPCAQKGLPKLIDHLSIETSRVEKSTDLERNINHLQDSLEKTLAQFKEIKEESKKIQTESKKIQTESKKIQTESKKIQTESKKIQTQSAEIQTQSAEIQTQFKKASRRIQNLQMELVAVLSIFAAIVMVFSGGLSFVASTISSMSKTSARQGLLFLPLAGLVIFNTIVVLMYLVAKIINRDILVACKHSGETKKCTCKPACQSIIQLKNRLPYVFWINAVFLGCIVVSVVLHLLTTTSH